MISGRLCGARARGAQEGGFRGAALDIHIVGLLGGLGDDSRGRGRYGGGAGGGATRLVFGEKKIICQQILVQVVLGFAIEGRRLVALPIGVVLPPGGNQFFLPRRGFVGGRYAVPVE